MALYTARNIDVVVMDSIIDISFMQHMEQQEDADGLTFARVDADVDGLVIRMPKTASWRWSRWRSCSVMRWATSS